MSETRRRGARINNVGDPLHGDDALNLRSADARYGTLVASHAAVTLGVGSDAALSLSGQQLTLATGPLEERTRRCVRCRDLVSGRSTPGAESEVRASGGSSGPDVVMRRATGRCRRQSRGARVGHSPGV